MTEHSAAQQSNGGRLQRPPTASGYRVETFSAVLRRHGLTMGCIALACLLLPGAWALLQATTKPLLDNPQPYLLGVFALIVFFALWSLRRPTNIRSQTLWILYLLYISTVEEIAFRLLLPEFFGTQLDRLPAHVVSNLIFATLHYFTLRWRLRNCVGTFAGGMGLSHLMAQGDLTLVILVHWFGTFLNTPRPPAGS